MRTIELLKILQSYPLFTENDVAKIIDKSPGYIKNLLYRIRKQKLIYKIERGKYSVHSDVFVFASSIYIPSYVSLWSALRYYNLTEQMPKTVFVMVPKSRKSLKFQNTQIEFVKTKNFFGFRKTRYIDFDIFMAEPEKAVIDSLLSGKVPFDEIIKAIKSRQLDVEKLINYAIKAKNKALIKRLGYILEDNVLKCEKLRKHIDNNYALLDLMSGKKGKKNKKWRIINNRQ